MSNQRIGELNGWWAWCFKFATLCIPILCGIAGWAIVDRVNIESVLSKKAEGSDLADVQGSVRAIDSRLPREGFPPQETRDRLARIETRIETVFTVLDNKIEKNAQNLTEILRLLVRQREEHVRTSP